MKARRITGELTPTVFRVTARSIACQGLFIFGDHSDVMAARVPFLHSFDGFRTSHEIRTIEELSFEDMRAMIDDELVIAHRGRALTPDRPTIPGTAQSPDVYFQGRKTVNPWCEAASAIVQRAMDRSAGITGRSCRLSDYAGHSEAEHVIVVMGSAAETAIASLPVSALPADGTLPTATTQYEKRNIALLLDLRRQPAGDALREAVGRARPGLVELPVRGQRRVRAGARRRDGCLRVSPAAGPRPPRPAGERAEQGGQSCA